MPREDYESFGASTGDLEASIGHPGPTLPPPAPLPVEWRVVLAAMSRRTRHLFNDGRLVCERTGGRLRYELRLTWHGGARILERVERSNFDVLRRPTLGARDAGTILWRAALWTAA